MKVRFNLSDNLPFINNSAMKPFLVFFAICFLPWEDFEAQNQVKIWDKCEISFTSFKNYENPIYEVRQFDVLFTSPTGRERKVYGFWDGGTD